MKTFKLLILYLVLAAAAATPSLAEMSGQLGVGYGREFRKNVDLSQYEIFYRYPLPYKTTLADYWQVSTDLEFGAALLREAGADNDGTGRFSIMPQVIISPHKMVNFIIGLGAGYMAGRTNFSNNDLGGHFLLNSKVGVQLVLGEHWGLEYDYYHQSNAGIYDENDGLNIHHFAFSYNF